MNKNVDEIEILGIKVKTKNLGLFILITIVGWFLIHWLFGTEIPGNWLEKGDYQTKLYVNVFPNDKNSKNYRLIADVERVSKCDNDGENSSCYSTYFLQKVYFPNGGYLEFDDCNIELNKKLSCIDNSHEDSWYIELTNQKP